MPVINIPGAIDYKAIRGVADSRTQRGYQQSLTRESDSRSKLNEQDAGYYDKTGKSRASQDQEKIDLSKDRNAIDAAELNRKIGEYYLNASKEHREQMQNFITQAAMVHKYAMDNPGDTKGAEALYKQVLGANPGSEEQFGKYDPKVLQALATVKQTNDPLAPLNYVINPGKPDMKIGSVARDDAQGIGKLMQQNAMFDPSGQIFNGLKDFNLTNNAAWRNNLSANESNFVQVHGVIDDLRGMMDSVEDWQRGLSGSALRKFDNMASAVSSLFTTVASESKGKIVQENGELIDESTWVQNKLGKYAGPAAAQYRLAVQLAYLTARMQEGSQGRALSENDLNRNIEGLVGSKTQQKATIAIIENQINNGMKFNYEQAQVANGGQGVPIPPTIKKYLGQDKDQGNDKWKGLGPDKQKIAMDRVKANPDLANEFEKIFGFAPK